MTADTRNSIGTVTHPHGTAILGVSGYFHDAAAALLIDGEVVAAAQEERFTRLKGDPSLPINAVQSCLRIAGLTLDDVDIVAFHEKPWIHFERLLEISLAKAPKGLGQFVRFMPTWIKEKMFLRGRIRRDLGWEGPVVFARHHESHMAAAFYPSPFQQSAILTIDGVGEWATTSWGVGDGNKIDLQSEIRFPHSLGLLYSAFTAYLGFRVNTGEYKVMGLAPYGEPCHVDLIREELVDLKDDGSFRLNMDYFDYTHRMSMTGKRFHKLFGGPPRDPEGPLEKRHLDLARSIQVVCEEAVLRMVRHVHRQSGQQNLVLGGGVALNCVSNGRVLREGPFEKLWIQPAAGDSGSALGAALVAWHCYLGTPRKADGRRDRQKGSLLGPAFTEQDILDALDVHGARYTILNPETVPDEIARCVEEGQVVGLLQGRMEFGPRALGNRSILGDPRDPGMQALINQKIKFRESFRPFAPAVPAEDAGKYFELDEPSPYMLLVAPVLRKRRQEYGQQDQDLQGLAKASIPHSDVPAVTHVDGSARIQTVDRATNPGFHAILRAFEARTGESCMVNTSFNVRGEPIVCTPDDAFQCFMQTGMDVLFLENVILLKREQPTDLMARDWHREFHGD